jgi:hypothetical protein
MSTLLCDNVKRVTQTEGLMKPFTLVKGFLYLLVLAGLHACLIEESVPLKKMVVAPDVRWKYFVGKSEPSADWRKSSFDDSHWTEGTGGIGYGDFDDGTVIGRCPSVYLRHTFVLSDLVRITSMDLYMDYDDGFVAYINDVEIARSEGMSGTHPSYDQLSTVSHEASLYQGALPERYKIPLNVLRPGENLLAIQVHNAREKSSDLSSNAYLIVEVRDVEKNYRPLPEWLRNSIEAIGSNLPIVVITTDNGAEIVDDPKVTAHMGIINNGNKQRNKLTDPYNEYDGYVGIEIRGYSSQMYYPKKSYAVETRDDKGNNLNVSLLGLPKENDWILNASYYDRSFIRTPLAHHLSRMMGSYSSRTVHCELVLNGDYKGLYIFMEKIKRDRSRVNVTRMDSTDVYGEAVTGGYIYEVGARNGGFDGRHKLVYPQSHRAMPEQIAYIKHYDDHFKEVIRRRGVDDSFEDYKALIDVDTFVDEILLQEITKNVDAYVYSSYFHKDRSRKLKAGPVWDFDQCFGNSIKHRGDLAGGWLVERHDHFWRDLFNDAEFHELLTRRWFELREGPFQIEALLNTVDAMAVRLMEAQKRNFALWPIIGKKTWREPDALTGIVRYQQEIDYMQLWIVDRFNWLDRYFGY